MGGGRSNGGYLGWQWVGSAVVAGSLEGMVMEMGKGTPAAPHPDEGRPVPHLPTILHPPSQVLQGVGRWGARPELKRLNPGGGSNPGVHLEEQHPSPTSTLDFPQQRPMHLLSNLTLTTRVHTSYRPLRKDISAENLETWPHLGSVTD